jgi:dienelactone hydrolase
MEKSDFEWIPLGHDRDRERLPMNHTPLQSGSGFFVFPDPAARPTGSIRVFTACPGSHIHDAPIVIAMHGVDRAAEAFRDSLADRAMRNGQLVLVPEFDTDQFPGPHAYNFGGVRLPSTSNAVLPREEWNFGLIDRLFHHVRQLIGSNRTTFGMLGNSAGSQYVLRYLALTDATSVDKAVASNSGIYMLPDLQSDYPDGMGGLNLEHDHLKRYFSRPLVILLGDQDTDTSDPYLPRSEIATAQGPHRLARGHLHFNHCRQRARDLGVPLNWNLEVVPGAGHISQQIFDRAVEVLKGI